MRQPKTDDNWRLRLVELLLPDWLLAPHQESSGRRRPPRVCARGRRP